MNKPKKLLLVGLLFLTFYLQAQHNHSGNSSDTAKSTTASVSNGNEQFKTQLTEVYQASLLLKEALVSADTKKAQQAASETKQALSRVDMNLLKDKAHKDWTDYQKDIKSSLSKIESESKIKTQRESFARLSEALYKSVKAFGVEKKQVHYQHCPMALDGQGAYWLSESTQIRNPYLGDKMLTCGSTKETIK